MCPSKQQSGLWKCEISIFLWVLGFNSFELGSWRGIYLRSPSVLSCVNLVVMAKVQRWHGRGKEIHFKYLIFGFLIKMQFDSVSVRGEAWDSLSPTAYKWCSAQKEKPRTWLTNCFPRSTNSVNDRYHQWQHKNTYKMVLSPGKHSHFKKIKGRSGM